MEQKTKMEGRLKKYLTWPLLLIIPFAVVDAVIFYYDHTAGLAMSACLLIYAVIMIISYRRTTVLLLEDLTRFADRYDTSRKKMMVEMDYPYAVTDMDGKVLWMNESFAALSGKDREYRKSITAIFPAITKEHLPAEGRSEYNFSWEGKQLRAIARTAPLPQEDMTDETPQLIGFGIYDETELCEIRRKNDEQKLVVARLHIDNYEEALDSIENVKRTMLSAFVDRKINQYFAKVDALVTKTEKDRYFIVFKKVYLQKLIDQKFSILDEVKTIKVGNEMAMTISLGIGFEDESYARSLEYSQTAMGLALGRGGDQAVVKLADKISYYGGSAQMVERNTRVKARVKAQGLREMMQSKQNVLVMGHQISDMDAFGAAVGVYCAARELGKKCQIVLNDVTTSLRPMVDLFTPENGYPEDMIINGNQALIEARNSTLIVVVDTNRPGYTECPELLQRNFTTVVVDHHRQGTEVIENPALSYIEPYASSACEMIAEVLQYFTEKIRLTPSEADCIYAGILVDTNNFMTKTGVRTFEAAAYLKRSGADLVRVRKLMRNDMASYKARAEVVRHAEVYRGVFAISVCNEEDLDSPTVVAAQAANELLNISGIRASFVMTAYKGRIFISSRSIDEINVQLIMERLGGGGHMNVAGAQMKDATLSQTGALLKETLDQMITEGAIKL